MNKRQRFWEHQFFPADWSNINELQRVLNDWNEELGSSKYRTFASDLKGINRLNFDHYFSQSQAEPPAQLSWKWLCWHKPAFAYNKDELLVSCQGEMTKIPARYIDQVEQMKLKRLNDEWRTQCENIEMPAWQTKLARQPQPGTNKHLYIFSADEKGAIKIGISAKPGLRKRALEWQHRTILTPVIIVPNASPLESVILDSLKQNNLFGEWVDDCESTWAAISQLIPEVSQIKRKAA